MTRTDARKLLGKRISAARLACGLKQPELARACGWVNEDGSPAQTRVSNYERGIREPAIQDMLTIAKATGQKLTYFYDLEEDGPTPDPKSNLYSSMKGAIALAEQSGESDLLEELLLEILSARRSLKRS